MKSPASHQWDFGDLFSKPAPASRAGPATPAAAPANPPPVTSVPTRKVLTVSELTRRIRELLEGSVGRVWITGEVTNLRFQASGHTYFTLKDAGSQVGCILFRTDGERRKELLQEGRKVTVQGEVTVYEPRGQYQLRVLEIELEGLGALQRAFEQLKQKLQAEGLFALERKRPLPAIPERIAIITSPTGAALRDILHVIARRQPSMGLVLVPSRVQGPGAADELARALQTVNRWNQRAGPADKVQLILLARGGGSLEDLWAFNEEVLARAIFHSELPVMSAVGHEIDVTISDFVADARAATPSAGAELLTDGAVRACKFIAQSRDRLRLCATRRLQRERDRMRRMEQGLKRVHPRRWLSQNFQRIDELESAMVRCLRSGVRNRRLTLEQWTRRLARLQPSRQLEKREQQLADLLGRALTAAQERCRRMRLDLEGLENSLRLLSPNKILERGYSITQDERSGKIIRAADEAKPGQAIRTLLGRGRLVSEVRQVEKRELPPPPKGSSGSRTD